MVQLSSTFVLATIAVFSASSMAIPLSQRNARDLQERSWTTLENDITKVASVFNREDELELRADKERKGTWPSDHERIASPPLKIDRKQDELDLLERDLEERGFWSSLKKGFGKVVNFAAPIVKTFLQAREDEHELSAREFEERELYLREDELELLERDLQIGERGFWSSVKKGLGKVVNFAAPIVKTFLQAREDEQDLAARDYNDLVYGRANLDINELD